MFDGANRLWMTTEDLPHYFCSFAQNFEDVILARVFQGETGFYIDAGANDPEYHSVTKSFYDKGWSGVNIEPHRGFYQRLCHERPRDVNLNVGLSDREAIATFHEVPTGMGISSLTTMYSDWNKDQVVEDNPIKVTTLARICEQHANRPIDFLKIDVEGVEREACEGGDWARWRPRVVLIEANFADTFEDWDSWFKDRGYLFAYFDRINRFYVRDEDRELIPTLALPFNSLDRAIPYDQLRLIKQLQEELNRLKGHPEGAGGPTTNEFVLKMKRLARRFPRSSKAVKQLLRRVG